MNKTDRPILDVYLALVPTQPETGPLYPPERAAWVAAASDTQVRAERYAVWKLLERGVRHSFGLAMEELHFERKQRKWSCDRLEFSLSHSGGLVAAALSDAPVGVDVETIASFEARGWDEARLRRIARRVCTAEELSAMRSEAELLPLWTLKESIYKRFGVDSVISGRIETAAFPTAMRRLSYPEPCVLSVCADAPERMRLFLADGTGLRLLEPSGG